MIQHMKRSSLKDKLYKSSPRVLTQARRKGRTSGSAKPKTQSKTK